MINVALIWSGICVETFLAIILIFWFAIFIYRYNQLKKFETKGGIIFEQNAIYLSSLILFGISMGVYLISLISGILFLATNSSNQTANSVEGILFETMFLIFIIIDFVMLILLIIYQNNIIIVFKNETLLTLNEIIKAKTIIQIHEDKRHHWIFINWKDPKQNRVREIKLKYNYRVKDYLQENGLWQEQEQELTK